MEVDWTVVVVDRFFTTLTLFMLGILILGIDELFFYCCASQLLYAQIGFLFQLETLHCNALPRRTAPY